MSHPGARLLRGAEQAIFSPTYNPGSFERTAMVTAMEGFHF
jgi:hypothetical protein